MTTFGILVLELALIRWTSGQVRVFAYVNNIVLITAFLGMGLGVALGKRYPGLVHGVLPALLLVALPVASSESDLSRPKHHAVGRRDGAGGYGDVRPQPRDLTHAALRRGDDSRLSAAWNITQ